MKYSIRQLEEIEPIAKEILPLIKKHKIVAFYGKMGAGKTTFIKGICKVLGCSDTVTSPTFALINEYQSPEESVFHFDFYRINKLEEIYDFGYEDYFYSGKICLIEWPELIEEVLPAETLRIHITEESNQTRILEIENTH